MQPLLRRHKSPQRKEANALLGKHFWVQRVLVFLESPPSRFDHWCWKGDWKGDLRQHAGPTFPVKLQSLQAPLSYLALLKNIHPLWRSAWQYIKRAIKVFIHFDPIVPLWNIPKGNMQKRKESK